MEKKLIKNVQMNCPLCKLKHPVDMYKREAKTIIKGVPVNYAEWYYFCDNASDEFETQDMYFDNESRAYAAYERKVHTGV